ncbi:MAG: hypothetical protein U0Q16_00740 [Bryobacteraceae bacterium]
MPSHIEVIELKKQFGVHFRVWIQGSVKSFWQGLDEEERMEWSLSKRATPGDLLLMYRVAPVSAITDVFRYVGGGLNRGSAGWRDGDAFFGLIERVCSLVSTVFYRDMRTHRVLKTAGFVRAKMQGQGIEASEYWPYLFEMIRDRNPAVRNLLATYAPGSVR